MKILKSNGFIIGLLIVLSILLFTLGRMSNGTSISPSMDDFNNRQAIRDSIYDYYEAQHKTDSLARVKVTKERDSLRSVVDGTLVVMTGLTNPVVTDQTINEALEWIEQHNDTL